MPYRFKEARLQAGLTTVQLAQKMGVTQAAVSHWDAGKKVPGTETLCKLADLYGVTIDYLLVRSNDTSSTNTLVRNNRCLYPTRAARKADMDIRVRLGHC